MRCYYEELDIAQTSNDADIKSAYRKLALRWHPDKNPDNSNEAKERFQAIQQAYEVLSDPHERSWYDNHRDQILRGKNSEYEENCLDVFQYFTVSCYCGHGDDPKSFYSVYRDVFQKIAAEDIEFMNRNEECYTIPEFGDSKSSYEDVVGPFYAYWQAYSTKKTYEWLCPYDPMEIKERFILRKVEKELKKIVQKARKERNEEVRNLVSFVRKRDRRVQAYKKVLEERAEANRLKQEEKRQEQLRKRQQDLAAARQSRVHNADYEEQLKQLEQQYGCQSDEYTDEDDDDVSEADIDSSLEGNEAELQLEYVDDLYCVACNKSFKNVNARANHEDSKKHRENVERLCQEMQSEEEAFNECNIDETDSIVDVEDRLDELQLNGNHVINNSQDESEEAEILPLNKRDKKSKKSKKSTAKQSHVEQSEDIVDEEFHCHNKEAALSGSDDDWGKGNANKKAAKKSKNKKNPNNQKRVVDINSSSGPPQLEPTVSAPTSLNATIGVQDNMATVSQHVCVTCQAVFDSKNKLFAHLKKTNHGVYIPKAKPDVEGKPPNKSKGKRK